MHDNTTGEAVKTPKSYGKSLSASGLQEGMGKFFPVGDAEGAREGLGRAALVEVLSGIKEEVAEIRSVVAELEVRMAGASLLIVYESDWEAESGYVVRLIDFAHAFLKPGSGPDEGLLLGLDTTLGLVNERLASVQ